MYSFMIVCIPCNKVLRSLFSTLKWWEYIFRCFFTREWTKNLPFKLVLYLNLSAFSIVANFFKWYGKITKEGLLLISRIWRIIFFFWILFIFEVSSMYIVFFLKIFINFVHNNSKTFISKCPKYAFFFANTKCIWTRQHQSVWQYIKWSQKLTMKT